MQKRCSSLYPVNCCIAPASVNHRVSTLLYLYPNSHITSESNGLLVWHIRVDCTVLSLPHASLLFSTQLNSSRIFYLLTSRAGQTFRRVASAPSLVPLLLWPHQKQLSFPDQGVFLAGHLLLLLHSFCFLAPAHIWPAAVTIYDSSG